MAIPEKSTRWVINPVVDLSCITLGWLLFFFAPYLFPQFFDTIRVASVTFLFATHRYFTFPLVYLDRAEFRRRPAVYVLIPILCFVFVGLCYFLRIDEPEMFAFWYLFNYFHFVRQKYGILRIYSGKARWGHKRLDEWTMYAWGLAGFCYLFASEAEVKVMYYLRNLVGFTPPNSIAHLLYGAAGLLTLFWLIHEFRAPEGISLPKLLFFASVVFLYGIGPTLSAGAIYIATSINHASEYIALVALTIKNKTRTSAMDAPLLNMVAGRITLYTFLFIVAICAILYGFYVYSLFAFLFFAYGTSFAHFVLDGMIWKLRRPKVAREVGTA
ncbi:MAG: hypothetical protein O7G87_19320 [bacterium]|nr:hypothetical protein [bacterium]